MFECDCLPKSLSIPSFFPQKLPTQNHLIYGAQITAAVAYLVLSSLLVARTGDARACIYTLFGVAGVHALGVGAFLASRYQELHATQPAPMETKSVESEEEEVKSNASVTSQVDSWFSLGGHSFTLLLSGLTLLLASLGCAQQLTPYQVGVGVMTTLFLTMVFGLTLSTREGYSGCYMCVTAGTWGIASIYTKWRLHEPSC